MTNKVHVIVNPLSARGKTEKKWRSIKEVISHYFKEFKYVFTEKSQQATAIARDLLKDGFDLIIGVGGDGTLNEIANGYFCSDTRQAINDEAALGIIPSGTGSDFIRFLKIPREFNKSVALIKHGRIRKIDVGKVTSLEGERQSKYFVNAADFGLGAEVMKRLSKIPPQKRNALFYYKGLLATIKDYKSKKIKIVIDDDEVLEDRYLIGAVANGRMFGGGMIIAPNAEPDDGYFDFVLARDMTRGEIILVSPRLYNGTVDRLKKVSIRRARNIKVFSDEGVDIECDGEAGPRLPVEFQVIEKGLNFRM